MCNRKLTNHDFLPAKTVLILISVILGSPALADPGKFEIAPYGAISLGGSFTEDDSDRDARLDDTGSFGILLDFREAANTQWEVIYSRQETEATISPATAGDGPIGLDVHYLQGGGTYQGSGSLVRPYLAATIGATHFAVRSGGFDSDTFFSFSLGPGLQIWPDRSYGLRLEARFFGTLVRSDSDLFCVSDPASMNAGCAIAVSGNVLWQTQLIAGFVARF